MKSILIVMHAMELGGAERALLGMLENIDYTQYTVDLFLLRHEGELLKYIPEEVNVLPENSSYNCMAVPIQNVLKKGKINIAYHRWLGKRAAKKRVNELDLPADNDVALEYSHKYTVDAMPMICDKEYDLVISYLTPHYYAARKTKGKKKIAWIHTDYSKVAVDKESQLAMWNQYDHIVSISDAVSETFLSVFPEMKEKVIVIENMMPEKLIAKQADEFPVDNEMPDDGRIKLLSIGRFSYAKNFDQIPDICDRILKRGLDVVWYIIGYGGDEQLIKDKIKEYKMENHVIILGRKENPYPYIKACDYYVQPSRYEGNSVSVHEAQLLKKPVIITNYATAKDQITDGMDGFIVPMDNEGCAEGIVRIVGNRNYPSGEIKTDNSLEKLYKLL